MCLYVTGYSNDDGIRLGGSWADPQAGGGREAEHAEPELRHGAAQPHQQRGAIPRPGIQVDQTFTPIPFSLPLSFSVFLIVYLSHALSREAEFTDCLLRLLDKRV